MDGYRRFSLIERSEIHLQCGLCLQRFNEPKELSCRHSYCRGCLEARVVNFQITCPECRRVTKVPGGDLGRLKPSFLLNELLSHRDDDQSDLGPKCAIHPSKVLILYCKKCKQMICQHCRVLQHRDHNYKYVRDVFNEEKMNVMTHVIEVEKSISVFKSAIEKIEEQEKNLEENLEAVRQDIDVFVNEQMAAIERKRRILMQDLKRLSYPQVTRLHVENEALVRSLNKVETGVGWARTALAQTDQARVLSMKDEIIARMKELSSLDRPPVPRETLSFKFEANPTLNDEIYAIGAKITESEKYTLSMVGGEPGVIYTTRAKQEFSFIITPFESQKEVKMRITSEDGEEIPLTRYRDDCEFTCRPPVKGLYNISVLINGVLSCGSPLTWQVEPAICLPRILTVCKDRMRNVISGKHPQEGNSVHPQDCRFSEGQHSWKVIQKPAGNAIGDKPRLGVFHSNRHFATYWKEGKHCSESHDGKFFEEVESSLHYRDIEDVFTFFLNVDKNQLIIYSNQTWESDTFYNIKAPVSPYIYPVSTYFLKMDV